MINQTRMERYQQAIEEATTIEERPARPSVLRTIVKATKITAITAVSIFALLLTALIVDMSNDTPEEKAAYGVHVEEKKAPAPKQPAQQVLPTEVKVAGTQSIDYKRATLRQILSQQYPLVSAYEVKEVNGDVFSLESVDPNSKDNGDFALEGQYQAGDIVVVMWANDSDEIAGSVKLASTGELDVQWNKGGVN